MIHPEYSINPGTPEDPPQVQTANDVAKNDPPPSYESLFGKIKRAKAESSGRVDFAKKSCSICTESGSVFLYDCRANEMVPVYLVVHGVFLIIAIIFGLLQTRSDKDKKKDSKKEKTPNEKCIELISTLIHVFLIAWFFYGNSITIGLNWMSSPATARTYCHPSLYYYAYWVIMSVYIFIGIVVFVSLCVVLYSCISGSKAKNNC